MARGGFRVGSGKKPKDGALAALHGTRRRPGVVRFPGTSAAVSEPVTMPEDLPAEQAAVWAELAPHAVKALTLTAQTVQAFRDLCEAVVLKRSMLSRIEKDGLTYLKVTVDGSGQEHSELKAHPLISQHRGMMQRVEAGMARFRLAPIGKAIIEPAQPVDPFAEFDQVAQ